MRLLPSADKPVHQVREDAPLPSAEPEQHFTTAAAPRAAVVVLPQRMVVRHARVAPLFGVERREEFARERVDAFELRAGRGRHDLITEEARTSCDTQTRAELERRAPVHGTSGHGREDTRMSLNVS